MTLQLWPSFFTILALSHLLLINRGVEAVDKPLSVDRNDSVLRTKPTGDLTDEVPSNFVDHPSDYNDSAQLQDEVKDRSMVLDDKDKANDPSGEKDNQMLSTEQSSSGLVKLACIIVVILIPLILLPILFVFVRRRNVSPDSYTPEWEMENLDAAISLFATIPEQDMYLNDQKNWQLDSNPNGVVHTDRKKDQLCYYLNPINSMVNKESGQLYHPPSGLVFIPLREYIFIAEGPMNIKLRTDEPWEPVHNQVFDPETKQLYERCLAVGYDTNLEQFYLPPQVQIPEDLQQTIFPVRRVVTEELPPFIDPQLYEQMLEKEIDSELKAPLTQVELGKPDYSQFVYEFSPRASIKSLPFQVQPIVSQNTAQTELTAI